LSKLIRNSRDLLAKFLVKFRQRLLPFIYKLSTLRKITIDERSPKIS